MIKKMPLFNKTKTKKNVFVCQIADTSIGLLRCSSGVGLKAEVIGFEHEELASGFDNKSLPLALTRIFKKLNYDNSQVILSIPRSKATCRYVKIPTQSPKELDSIISLQVPRYLPYPAAELISGYQVAGLDQQGYSEISLTIVHKDIVERIINACSAAKITRINIYLSCYGLANFYDYVSPASQEITMLADVNHTQTEIALTKNGKLIFSRYFKFDSAASGWHNLFVEEIIKTRDAYIKETSCPSPSKVVIIGDRARLAGLLEDTQKRLSPVAVESLAYEEKVAFSESAKEKIQGYPYSIANLIGFSLGEVDPTLTLLPPLAKEKTRMLLKKNEFIKIGIGVAAIMLMFGLGLANNLHTKRQQLAKLKIELAKVEKEAKSLEGIEKRLEIFQGRSKLKPSALDLVSELYKVIPDKVSLVNLSYEENTAIILHGITVDLSKVFELVASLEKSSILKDYNVKVRYASKKMTQAGEMIDFEIVSLKKK